MSMKETLNFFFFLNIYLKIKLKQLESLKVFLLTLTEIVLQITDYSLNIKIV